MTTAPCGSASCPVPPPDPTVITAMRAATWPAGTVCRRGHAVAHPDATELVPGVGSTRFAPLPGVAHVYLALQPVPALLESALHDAVPGHGRIWAAQLPRWMESAVQLTTDVQLIDLRDDQLVRLGLQRSQLVSTSAAHYPCTRRWAAALHGREVDGQPTTGMVWSSRQVELQANALANRPALRSMLVTGPTDVAVIWLPERARSPLLPHPGGLGPLAEGPGLAFATDLAATLGIPIH